MFYKLVIKFSLSVGSISVAFEFILGSFSFLLGYNARIAPSVLNEKYPQNTLQNQLELIYRTYLPFLSKLLTRANITKNFQFSYKG